VKKVDYLGLSGFPYGLAAVEKQKLIARGLVNAGVNVTVICNRWGSFNSDQLKRKGNCSGVNYIYTTPFLSKPAIFFVRRITLFIGWWGEILNILFRRQDAFLVSSEDFFQVMAYSLVAKIKRKKIFLTYVEEVSELFAGSAFNRFKVFLFNKYTWKIIDGALPISEYLIKKVREKNPSLPLMKLPTLADFSLFPEAGNKKEKYFLFCGAARYLEVIQFIIDSFDLVEDQEYSLYLVSGGSADEIENVNNAIDLSSRRSKIKRFGFLSYNELIEKYINATGLLIPLRNNIRDIARFPHKIGEYCASRVPIISTNVGEMNFYFSHKESALMAQQFNPVDFAGQMQFVIDNPQLAENIGKQSRLIGENHFDYNLMGKKVCSFLGF